ncbi:MAG: LysM peptidoglycan-binding domain-containing protein [Lysinibacillus sp.]
MGKNKWAAKLAAVVVGSSIFLSSVGSASASSYTVKPGDSLWKIAMQQGVTTQKLMQWNNLSSGMIYPGQKLKVTAVNAGPSISTSTSISTNASAATYTVKAGDTLSGIAKKYGTTYQRLQQLNNLSSGMIYPGQKLKVTAVNAGPSISTSTSISTNASAATYTVKAGDTLSGIAKKYGTTYQRLQQLNNLSSTKVYIGQKLKVSGSTATAAPVKANIVDVAKKYLGIRYTYGGVSPSRGFDCSGFVTYVYNEVGNSTPRRTAAGFYSASKKVSTPQVGDLVFFKGTTSRPGITHVGIYIGNNQMINASNSGVTIANVSHSYWKQRLAGYGRI